MEDLVHLVSVNAGISIEQAQIAVQTVTNELKKNTPSILHKEIDSVLKGKKFGDAFRANLDDLKNDVEKAARQAGDKAEIAFKEVREKFAEFFSGKK
jgi:hypothetical protein